jgi:hypothetical protein
VIEVSGSGILNLRFFYLGGRPPEEEAFLDSIDPDRWYPLEEFLPHYRAYCRRDPDAARWQMRALAYIFRDELLRQGARTPQEGLDRLPELYARTTRGDPGFGYRTLEREPGRCVLEKDTWGDCYAALGTLEGVIKSFDGQRVRIRHVECREIGDARCVYQVQWRDPPPGGRR